MSYQIHLPAFLDPFFKNFESMDFMIPFGRKDIKCDTESENGIIKLELKIDNVWYDINNLSTEKLLNDEFIQKCVNILKKYISKGDSWNDFENFTNSQKRFKK